MTIRCEKCGSTLYVEKCLNTKCSAFSLNAALDYVEDELLPDMCLDFEGFSVRQSADKRLLNNDELRN